MSVLRIFASVWTAPWQELSDIAAALLGCGHVSGLLMRHGWPLALILCGDAESMRLVLTIPSSDALPELHNYYCRECGVMALRRTEWRRAAWFSQAKITRPLRRCAVFRCQFGRPAMRQ
jgi:hypothetical protein